MSYRTFVSRETTASPERIWQFFRDVLGWKAWNAGIEEIAIHGPFEVGTRFTMKPPGQDALESVLVEVRENECFVDETAVGDLVVRVAHRVTRVFDRTLIVYALEAAGPEEEEIGRMIASDFGEVIASLVLRSEAAPDV